MKLNYKNTKTRHVQNFNKKLTVLLGLRYSFQGPKKQILEKALKLDFSYFGMILVPIDGLKLIQVAYFQKCLFLGGKRIKVDFDLFWARFWFYFAWCYLNITYRIWVYLLAFFLLIFRRVWVPIGMSKIKKQSIFGQILYVIDIYWILRNVSWIQSTYNCRQRLKFFHRLKIYKQHISNLSTV